MVAGARKLDANNQLYAIEAVMDYDPSPDLEKIKARVDTGKLAGRDEIGLRVGKVINQYKVAKHFELAIGGNTFTFARKSGA